MHVQPEQRECGVCHFKRIPYAHVVKKRNKHWIIFTCPMCKSRDLDEYKPARLLNGLTGRFEEESFLDEDLGDE